MKLKILYIIS